VIVDGKPLVQQWLACELKNQGPLISERVGEIAAAAERQRRQLESVSTGAGKACEGRAAPASARQQRRPRLDRPRRQDRRGSRRRQTWQPRQRSRPPCPTGFRRRTVPRLSRRYARRPGRSVARAADFRKNSSASPISRRTTAERACSRPRISGIATRARRTIRRGWPIRIGPPFSSARALEQQQRQAQKRTSFVGLLGRVTTMAGAIAGPSSRRRRRSRRSFPRWE